MRYDFGGLIFGGAYKWRGLFSELYGSFVSSGKYQLKFKGNIFWKGRLVVCYTAVISVVTQRFSPLTSGEERCVTTLITAV